MRSIPPLLCPICKEPWFGRMVYLGDLPLCHQHCVAELVRDRLDAPPLEPVPEQEPDLASDLDQEET